jgi:hypothetical protein
MLPIGLEMLLCKYSKVLSFVFAGSDKSLRPPQDSFLLFGVLLKEQESDDGL